MWSIKRTLIILFALSLLTAREVLCQETHCQLPTAPGTVKHQEWIDRIGKARKDCWQPYEFSDERYVRASFGIKSDGTLTHIYLHDSSWNVPGDASVLESLYNCDNLGKVPTVNILLPEMPQTSPPIIISIKVEEEDIKDRFSGAIAYYKENPELAKTTFALHKIPLSVLLRYPGIFSRLELTDKANVITFPKNSYSYRRDVRVFFAHWLKFFRSHPSANRAEIESFAQSLMAMKQPMLSPEDIDLLDQQ